MSDMGEDVPTRVVVCDNPDCNNNGVMVSIRAHDGLVICGACGTVLQEPS